VILLYVQAPPKVYRIRYILLVIIAKRQCSVLKGGKGGRSPAAKTVEENPQ
jgi:hypothetical protein